MAVVGKVLSTWMLAGILGILAISAGGESGHVGMRPARTVLRSDQQHVWRTSSVKQKHGCTDAKAMKGSHPKAIDFVIECDSPSDRRRIGLVVERYHLMHPGRLGQLGNYRRTLQVRGVGNAKPRICRVKRRVLTCRVGVSNPVALEGRIWAKGQDRCTLGVSIVEIRTHTCKQACQGPVFAYELFRGRPRGC